MSAAHLVRAAGGAHAADGLAGRRDRPSYPHDVQPDELDIAIGIDRMQQALAIEVRRVERSLGGTAHLHPRPRTWRSAGTGDVEGFFWCVGQGGYGIQTSPAAGRLVADLIAGRDPGALGPVLATLDPRRFTTPG